MYPAGRIHIVDDATPGLSRIGNRRAAHSASPEPISPRTTDRVALHDNAAPMRSYSDSIINAKRPREDRSLFEPAPKQRRPRMLIIRANPYMEIRSAEQVARDRVAVLARKRDSALQLVDFCERRFSQSIAQKLADELMLEHINENSGEYLTHVYSADLDGIQAALKARVQQNSTLQSLTAESYEHAITHLVESAQIPREPVAQRLPHNLSFIKDCIRQHILKKQLAAQARSAPSSSHGITFVEHIVEVERTREAVGRSTKLLERLGIDPDRFPVD